MKLEDKAAVVTGGASGLGGATAEMLARRGVKVAIFDVNDELGKAKAEAIGGLFVKVDIVDEESVREALDTAQRRHGVARILVNCAGVAPAARTVGRDNKPASLTEFARVVSINLVGTFNLIAQFAARAAGIESIDEERGVIINTASVAAFDGQIGQAAYAASKGGVVGLTLPVARDLAAHAIRVVTIAPGVFLTPMVAGMPQNVQDALGKQVPFPNRLGRPSEYASLVETIVGNAFINGETIRIDGAIRMPPK